MKHHGLKKLLPYFTIAIFLIIAILITHITGALQLNIAANSFCRPGIREGTIIAISSWKKPERNNYISFYELPAGSTDHKSKGVLRLTGMPGDTIEIRNGDLFVNNQPADPQLDLIKEYSISKQLSEKAIRLLRYQTMNRRIETSTDSVFLQLGRKELLKLENEKIPTARRHLAAHMKSAFIAPLYKADWNNDHFGPYIVPAGHYFLLGDNRNDCRDSRHFGPLPAERLAGTVLNH